MWSCMVDERRSATALSSVTDRFLPYFMQDVALLLTSDTHDRREMLLNLSSPPEFDPSNAAISGERLSEIGAARVGSMLKGKWHLDAVLGSGGTATVYAATHRNGNRVAVKVLHPCFSTMPAERERFAREGYFANKVDHPDVVRVLDEDVDDDGSQFLVMELLDGEPLVARWKAAGYRLPVPEALWIADRLLSVLEAAHARGIVHRDVKPENLFLTAAGGLKVLDFGIARLRGVGSGTMRGIVLGTPGFTAPEQARGEWDIVGARTDIWAVGATLFALLTGRLVHEDQQTAAHLLRVSTEPAPPVRQVEPNLPEAVARLIDRALAFSPEARFPSAAEMRHALAAAYRITTGHSLGDNRPGGEIGSAPHTPTLRVSTGTTVITNRSRTRLRAVPIDRWDAIAMATAFFALGGIVVGSLASGQSTAGDSAREAAVVAPSAPVAPVETAPATVASPPAAVPAVTNGPESIAASPPDMLGVSGEPGGVEAPLVVDDTESKPSLAANSAAPIVPTPAAVAAPTPARPAPVRSAVRTPAANRAVVAAPRATAQEAPLPRTIVETAPLPVPAPPAKRPLRPTGDHFDFVETRR
jgi:eukaryotic-like serine/threonine-protein kinase